MPAKMVTTIPIDHSENLAMFFFIQSGNCDRICATSPVCGVVPFCVPERSARLCLSFRVDIKVRAKPVHPFGANPLYQQGNYGIYRPLVIWALLSKCAAAAWISSKVR